MVIVGKFQGQAQRLWMRDDLGSQYYAELVQHEPEVIHDLWAPATEWRKVRQVTEFTVFEQDTASQVMERIAHGTVQKGGFPAALDCVVEAIRIFEGIVAEAEAEVAEVAK